MNGINNKTLIGNTVSYATFGEDSPIKRRRRCIGGATGKKIPYYSCAAVKLHVASLSLHDWTTDMR